MEMELNDAHLGMLLIAINEKLSQAEDPQFGHSLASVASFAMKLITTVVVVHADSRKEALEGVRSALADCEIMVNKAYDVFDVLNAAADGKVH
jgi:hypothetical protein